MIILDARETQLLRFLQEPKQFVIPIYQRTYNWKEKQCKQLWDDIIRIAQDDQIKSHFIGSIVYVQNGLINIPRLPRFLVIDGQQRLTTLALLLLALSKSLENVDIKLKEQIDNYYLFNGLETGATKHKLVLTKSDKDTLMALLEDTELPEKISYNITNNFAYFQNMIARSDLPLVQIFLGIQKLAVVSISLDRTQDNPQLIFESLNSTGLELSQVDLIRNYILIELEPDEQTRIYEKHWYPMEVLFTETEGNKYFDRFVKDYLTIKTGKIPNVRNIYPKFKEFVTSSTITIEDLVSELNYFSKFYILLVSDNENQDPLLETNYSKHKHVESRCGLSILAKSVSITQQGKNIN